jgi:hypothetical protein
MTMEFLHAIDKDQLTSLVSYAFAVVDGDPDDGAQRMLELGARHFGRKLAAHEVQACLEGGSEAAASGGALILGDAGSDLNHVPHLVDAALVFGAAVAQASEGGINATRGGRIQALARGLGITPMSAKYNTLLGQGMTMGRT